MQNSDYLISENPMKALVFFSLPMIIGNLFQQAYTIVDSAIVGHYNGEAALAAVGALCPGDSPERRVAEVPVTWCQSGTPGGMLASLLCGETDE